jgi:hypothetical protein
VVCGHSLLPHLPQHSPGTKFKKKLIILIYS